MIKVLLNDENVSVSCASGVAYQVKLSNMWLDLLDAVKLGEKIIVQDHRENLEEHQYKLDSTIDTNIYGSYYDFDYALRHTKQAKEILEDNGIPADEAGIVLQAIGYALLDKELYPEEV